MQDWDDSPATAWGCLSVDPAEAVAGAWGTWRLTFRVGRHGIDDEGLIRFAWYVANDWAAPQFDDPAGDHYTTVTTTGRAELARSFSRRGHTRPWFNVVEVRVHGGHLRPGDRVVVTLGDRSGGSRGIQAPMAADPDSRFQAFVDPAGTRSFRAVGKPVPFAVHPGPPRFLRLVSPAKARPGQVVTLRVVSEDDWGNPTPLAGPPPRVDVHQAAERGLEPVPVELLDTQPHALPGVHTGSLPGLDEGVYVAIARAGAGHVEEDRALLVVSGESPDLLWADLHEQTCETIGLTTAAASFRFAREVAGLDAVAPQGNDFDLTPGDWAEVCRMADEANVDGDFVVLRGYEWSGNIPGGGDRNVLFAGTDSELVRSGHWYGDEGALAEAYPLDQLYPRWRGRADLALVPHVGGRYANLDFHDPALEPAIEVCSGWGHHDWFWLDALQRGLVVGFLGGSDEHRGRPGASTPSHLWGVAGGLTAFLGAERTRQGVIDALRSRACYATSGARLYLEAHADGRPFGACLPGGQPFAVQGRAASARGLDRVEVCRVLPGAGEPPQWTTLWSRALADPLPSGERAHRVRLRWRGNHPRMRARPVVWDGRLDVQDGRLAAVEPYGFDRHLPNAVTHGPDGVTWRSRTVGNEQGVVVTVDGTPETRLRVTTAAGDAAFALSELAAGPAEWWMGPDAVLHAERLPAAEAPLAVAFEWTDPDPPAGGRAAYVLRVYDAASHFALGSPFYAGYGEDRA